MQLRSGKITTAHNKYKDRDEIVLVIKTLISKAAYSNDQNEKIKYCTRIFNYLLQYKNFVTHSDHKRFYISVVNKILDFGNEDKLINYPLYKGTKYYFEKISGIPYHKVIISKYLNNDFKNNTVFSYQQNFFYRNDQIKSHIEIKEKICRNINFKKISLYKICYKKISEIIKEKNLDIKGIRKLKLTYLIQKDLIDDYLIINLTKGDKNYNSWDHRLRKLPSRI